MSIVSAEISGDNPVTTEDVQMTLGSLGFELKQNEAETHKTLLAAAYETFETLSALPSYDLPLERPEHWLKNLEKVGESSNIYGHAWSYRFCLEAEISMQSQPVSLLAGRTIVLKDNICIAGVPQFNGTDAIEPWTPRFDATIVSRILKAGGRIVGTATCEAMSCATVSNTASSGPIYNPYANGYSAGGSSSGVAALVGGPRDSDVPNHSRCIDMGIGADQGGSIRVPAAFCGLVGLKATHGLIPYTGVTPCEAVLDHVGPMCTSVWDTAVLLEVIAGYDGIDDRQIGAQKHGTIKYSSNLEFWYQDAVRRELQKPLKGRKIAILKEALHAPFVKDEMKSEVKKFAAQLESLGAEIDEISMEGHDTGRSLWMAVCRQSLTSLALGNPAGRRSYYHTDFLENILPWSQDTWDALPIAMRNEFINGIYERKRYPTLYAKCMNLALKLRREYELLFHKYDVLLLPTVPFTAPPLFDRGSATPWEVVSSTFGQTLNTMQFNLTGHPAMSLPVGMRADMSGRNLDIRLPVACQLVGPLQGEDKILEIGYAYEQAYDWKTNLS